MHGGVGHIGMPLLADTNHAIARAYNVLKEDEGVAFRYRIYIRGDFMEQELRFGLDLGRFGNFWGRFFHVFMGIFFFLKKIVDGENIFAIEWS